MKATIPGGEVTQFDDCYITIPGFGTKFLNNLPELGDSKSASYNDEPIIGRTQPLKTYSHSDNRAISMKVNLFILKQSDIDDNIKFLRAIQSATYPQSGNGNTPFRPPPVCQIRCGEILSGGELCVVLKNYDVQFPTDVVWDQETMLPYKFSVSMNWEVVYSSKTLPGQDRILSGGD